MSAVAVERRYTPEEYLALERHALVKSEYVNGRIYAMSGASREHNLVGGNIFREISIQFRNRPCEVYTGDMRVRVAETGVYTYPDVVAVCGEPLFDDRQLDTLLNPTVIVEVLSPSTEAYDRGNKFAYYRRLASLQEYILVSQDRIRVERYTREEARWVLEEVSGRNAVLPIAAIGCHIPLREIYAKVSFPDSDSTKAV